MDFDLPFRLGAGGEFATVSAGSPGDIVARCAAILRSRLLYRDDAPEFGIDDPYAEQGGANLDVLREAIEKFAPDAARVIARDPALLQSVVDHITITPAGGV